MAETQGNLEDFFDFDQLDVSSCNIVQQEHTSSSAFPFAHPDAPQDWRQDLASSGILAALPFSDLPNVDQHYPDQDFNGHMGQASVPEMPQFPLVGPDLSNDREQTSTFPEARNFGLVQSCDMTPISLALQPFQNVLAESPAPKNQERVPDPSADLVPVSRRIKPPSSKARGPQSRIPPESKEKLELEFASNPYPCHWEIDIIAHKTGLEAKRVRNWFNNTRARKQTAKNNKGPVRVYGDGNTSPTKLSWESLEALSMQMDEGPQPPLAAYLASSYDQEAATVSAIRAAIEKGSTSDQGEVFMDSSSGSWVGKSGSVLTSLTSSDGSVPTSYTASSSGSHASSFGRDRRRGRRRMSWRTSPYGKINPKDLGLGTSRRELTFLCTFCPRAFKTKYEWKRHEDSIHALRTTWICCSTNQDPLQPCLFCGRPEPDEYHMSTHRYQQCRNKPEQQRTFFRRDHFIQHLHHVHFANSKHPSEDLGCQGRLTTSQGHKFGCKDLSMVWRKFSSPMRPDDPMLHCGFCGETLNNWNARCDHVAEHLITGGWPRSAWWPKRLQNRLDNLCIPQTTGPFRCQYCQKVFTNAGAIKKHSHCLVWSCRFLRTFNDIASESSGPPLCPHFPSPKAHHCHLCGAGYRSTTSHIEHAQQYHSYRQCGQDFYSSEQDFLEHLHLFHKASPPPLLQHKAVIEQNFSKCQEAVFEPINFDEILQGCRIASPSASFVDPFPIEETIPMFLLEENDIEIPKEPPRRTTRDRISRVVDIPAKVRRQRSHRDKSSESEELPGPRFFRLDPIVPFLTTRIYFLRNAKMRNLFNDGKALLEEMPHSHIASLVMSSGLVGMAGVRFPVQMKKDVEKGLVEFALED
ncbi:hypothetical protein CC78DRAFT_570927 [Lojkania enalia]|uniref:Uncharacterized protein n=1 Tax=Lojkania enalia TaxID=147567 RepID=A0A9P4N0W7_9PLEO|nr:hypothetical protein CC78DRAFT_570927 [Didymosphaeria enalia]